MVWGEIGAGLFGAGTSWINQMLSYQNNKKLQENQAKLNYKYAQMSAENSPTWNRAGLVSAGYNPMLAVQNATAGANSNWTGSAHADMADPMAAASNATSIYQAGQRLENETNTAESTVKTNEATARNQNAQAANEEAQNPYISQKAEKELGLLDAETTKLNKEADNIEARLKLDQYLGELGFAVQRRGQDKAYNASKYASDVSERNNIRTNHTERGRTRAGGASFFLDKYKEYP